MSSENQTLYIKGSRDVEVTKPDVTLGDILTMECSDKKLLPKIKTIRLLKFHGRKAAEVRGLRSEDHRVHPRTVPTDGSAESGRGGHNCDI